MSIKVKSIVEDPQLIARRRSQLVLAAIALFSRQGFHSTTVKDIAARAQVSAGLVYQYVHDKQDLLFLALLHIVERNRWLGIVRCDLGREWHTMAAQPVA